MDEQVFMETMEEVSEIVRDIVQTQRGREELVRDGWVGVEVQGHPRIRRMRIFRDTNSAWSPARADELSALREGYLAYDTANTATQFSRLPVAMVLLDTGHTAFWLGTAEDQLGFEAAALH